MGFDSSGTFSRIASGGSGISDGVGSTVWQGDAAAGTKIRADRHDFHDQDLANGLSDCLTRSGKGVPSVDIPWGGKKIINLQNPGAPQDAATKDYVDNPGPSTKSRDLSGADADGRLNFTSPTGVNGITWTAVDMSWLGRPAVASQTSHRLVVNDKVDGSGSDVAIIDDLGHLNLKGRLVYNLSVSASDSKWRTIAAGYGTSLQLTATGLHVEGLDTPTSGAAFLPVDPTAAQKLRGYFDLSNSTGNILMTLDKSASGKYSGIAGQMNGVYRWIMYLGDNHVEDASNNGSDFYLYAYTNAGVASVAMTIDRSSKVVNMPGGVNISGSKFLVDTAGICTALYFQSTGNNYGGNGQINLRPVSYSSGTGQTVINSAGDMNVSRYITANGYLERAGTAAADGSQYFNFDYVGGAGPLHAWINGADLGAVAFTCDYRLKKDVQPLERTWDKVKALRPVSFSRRDWVIHEGEGVGRETWLSRDSNEVEWGFVAHELQETLLPSAANGRKDQEDVVQSPNLPAIVAALTAALQEAMARIEALEAKA